jgi:hypothetical protein
MSFGIVIGREILGGKGKNFLNPVLVGLVFLYASSPQGMVGEAVWRAVDTFTGPTVYGEAVAAETVEVAGLATDWLESFLGLDPGTMGASSAFAAILGAGFLIYRRVASPRIMAAIAIGMVAVVPLFNQVEGAADQFWAPPWFWHLAAGSFAFGAVFLATDPASASGTETGQWVYGLFIGAMVVVIRLANPAHPDGVLFAILLGNIFAPLIDHVVVWAHIRKRARRDGRGARILVRPAAGAAQRQPPQGGPHGRGGEPGGLHLGGDGAPSPSSPRGTSTGRANAIEMIEMNREPARPARPRGGGGWLCGGDARRGPRDRGLRQRDRSRHPRPARGGQHSRRERRDPERARHRGHQMAGEICHRPLGLEVRRPATRHPAHPRQGVRLDPLPVSRAFGRHGIGRRPVFFEHGETPGLGALANSPGWRRKWAGKTVWDEVGKPALAVVMGRTDPSLPTARYQVDGITGATWTSRGVINPIRFWLGDDGFGPYLKKLRRR